MIHKVEILNQFTYPLAPAVLEKTLAMDSARGPLSSSITPQSPLSPPSSSPSTLPSSPSAASPSLSLSSVLTVEPGTPPYRTVSHYGFNCPLNYLPSIALHPAGLLTSAELQQHDKVINIDNQQFINSATLILEDSKANNKKNLLTTKRPTTSQSSSSSSSPSLISLMHERKNDSFSYSFISMKEIQLQQQQQQQQQQHRGRLRGSSKCIESSSSSAHAAGDESNDSPDHISEQFNGSVFMSSPTISRQSHRDEDEHDSSNVVEMPTAADASMALTDIKTTTMTMTTTTTVTSIPTITTTTTTTTTSSSDLHRSYILRNFLPVYEQQPPPLWHPDHHHILRSLKDIQQKPESEQALHMDGAPTTSTTDFGSPRKLTWKRMLPTNSKAAGSTSHLECCDTKLANCSTSDSRSSTMMKSMEIHIDVIIRNSDSIKNLEINERDLKMQLAKVIDNEIHAISRRITEQQQQQHGQISATNDDRDDGGHCYRHPHRSSSPSDIKYIKNATMVLLEQELQSLLNGIVRANEFHNRAILCDCKARITQISDDIRASLASQ